jgi:hypothetical protein
MVPRAADVLQLERDRRTGSDRTARQRLELRCQQAIVDHRIPPIVEPDQLGQELGAKTVARAPDRVDSKRRGHAGICSW